jgi:hypothetical protein
MVLSASWLTMAPAAADFALKSALTNPAPDEGKLIDLARSGDRLFVVGARGLIAYSDDGGDSWSQATVPVSGTLTAITFTPGGTGFAVGHGGVILRSTTAGESWEKVFDGLQANEQFLAWATENSARLEQELADLEAAVRLDVREIVLQFEHLALVPIDELLPGIDLALVEVLHAFVRQTV